MEKIKPEELVINSPLIKGRIRELTSSLLDSPGMSPLMKSSAEKNEMRKKAMIKNLGSKYANQSS
jgi:hypothetical protein